MYPKELNSAVEFLNTLTIQIAEGHEDGRVNSIADEDTIIDLLAEKYGNAIEKPVAREWWDVKIYVEASKEKSEDDGTYVHQGLAQRSFQRAWTLSDDTEVRSVEFNDGLLSVVLGKVVPDHHKRVDYI